MASPVDDVKARLDIGEVIGREVRLQRAGRYLKGLCPFHAEKTPSFFVFGDRGTFKCFGCGEGGDLFSYVQKRDNLAFPEALRILADEAGVQLQAARADPEATQRRNQIKRALDQAARVMHDILRKQPAAEKARAYVAQRGLVEASIETFQLGYAPSQGSPVMTRLRALGFDPDIIAASGLTRDGDRGPRDYFFDRLIFPIWDRSGAPVGFGGRAFGDAAPKYLNTSDSAVFTKGHNLYAYHLARDAIRREGVAVIVEGYMDAIAAHEHGFTNTVASMGTALTAEQANLLRAAGARRIVLALDADTAGAAATRRGIDVLRTAAEYEAEPVLDLRGLVRHEDRLVTDIDIVELPAGEDPDALIRRDASRWRSLLAAPTPLADYYFTWATREHDLTSLAGRRQAVRDLAPIIRELRDPVVREHYVNRLAEISGIGTDELRRLVRTARSPLRVDRNRGQVGPKETAADRVEEGLVSYVLQSPAEQLDTVVQLDSSYLSDPTLRHIVSVVAKSIQEQGCLNLDAVEADLDEASGSRFAALLDRARTEPLSEGAYLNAFQSATLRLRKRRLEAELQEVTRIQSGGDAIADSQDFGDRVTRLAQELLSVSQAERELSVLTAGPG